MKICKYCKQSDQGNFSYCEKMFKNGTWHIWCTCLKCGGGNGFVRTAPPFEHPLQFYLDWAKKTQVNYLRLRLEKTILKYGVLVNEKARI